MNRNSLLLNRDFFFKPCLEEIYIYFIDFKVNFINIQNKKEVPLYISHYQRIGTIIKYKARESYFIEINNYLLAAKSCDNKALIIAELIRMFNLKPAIIRILNPLIETKLLSGITIYRNKKDIIAIRSIAKKYSRI